MPQILILRGLPASGKSTYAKQLVQERTNGWKRVNKDDLRAMIDCSQYSKGKNGTEQAIIKARDAIIRVYMQQEKNIVVDDTNFEDFHVRDIKKIASENEKYTVKVQLIDTPLEECLRRDSLRGEASVGEDVILRMHEKYIAVKAKPEPLVAIQDQSLPKCIVIDIDGSVAKINPEKSRSPFDMSRVIHDLPNHPISDLVIQLIASGSHDKYVFVSGREDCAREDTIRWIEEHILKPVQEKKMQFMGIPGSYVFQDNPVELHMRKTKDNRKDYIIKEEIYKNNIIDRFNIDFVIDDRRQVVDHIRSLGFVVLQVAEGNF